MHDRLMPRVGKLLAIVLLLIAVQAVTADPANCQERDTDTATAQKEKAARRARSTNFRTKARKVKEGEAIADQATFETAYLAAVEAFESMRSTAVGLKIAEENGDQEARDELEAEKKERLAAAQHAHREAFKLADGSKPEELATLRSNLAYLLWESGEAYDAAVLGEFLARTYPDQAVGRQGARIAMESFAKLYADSTAADKLFEEAQVRRVAGYILERWPKEEDAEYAALKLLHFAVLSGQIEEANRYLAAVPADSPRRAATELRMGQSLWVSYLQKSQAPADQRPPEAELTKLKLQARTMLEGSLEKLSSSGPSTQLIAAVLSLAQMHLDASEPVKAIELLEQDSIGPLKLVDEKSPLVQNDALAIEAYKAALRAYIAVQPQQLGKAEQVMNALDERVAASGDAKTSETLTLVYISLSRELQRQLQKLRKADKQKELQAVSKGFEIFLDRVAKRNQGNSYSSLNWIAETFYSLGAGLDDESGSLSPEAKSYYERAADSYRRLIAMVQAKPSLADEDVLFGIRLRLAVSLRRSGEYEQALKILAVLVKENPNNLTAQVQAAETYQAQGSNRPDSYVKAIAGGEPDDKGANLFWGYAKLSKLTMSNPKLASTFHQSRLKLAESRFKYGLKQREVPDRKRHVEGAKNELWITYKLYPELGGPEFEPQYERLLRRLQKSLGEKELGLKEFRDRAATGASTAKTVSRST